MIDGMMWIEEYFIGPPVYGGPLYGGLFEKQTNMTAKLPEGFKSKFVPKTKSPQERKPGGKKMK